MPTFQTRCEPAMRWAERVLHFAISAKRSARNPRSNEKSLPRNQSLIARKALIGTRLAASPKKYQVNCSAGGRCRYLLLLNSFDRSANVLDRAVLHRQLDPRQSMKSASQRLAQHVGQRRFNLADFHTINRRVFDDVRHTRYCTLVH